MSYSLRFLWPFWFLVLGLALALSSPYLFSRGMFLDGLIYSTVSRNLAEGLGTFWNPHYSETLFSPAFREHPPLAFWMEASFFQLFGDQLFVEKLYSVSIFSLCSLFMILIWRLEASEKALSYFPLMIWVACIGVMWCVCSNMLENTMALFVLASYYCYLLGRRKLRLFWIGLSGFCIFAAFLTKGPTGLFPLALPGIYWITRKDRLGTFLRDQSTILLGVAFPLVILWFFSTSAQIGLQGYVETQIFGSFKNVVTVDSRFYILRETFESLLPSLAIGAFVLFAAFKMKGRFQLDWSSGLPFLLTGASGILPIMISLKQRGFYVMSAIPVLVLGLALVLLPSVKTVLEYIYRNRTALLISRVFSVVIVFLGIGLSVYNSLNPLRDPDLLRDMGAVTTAIPRNSLVGMSPDHYFNNLHVGAYLGRYSNISVEPTQEPSHEFYISGIEEGISAGYQKVSQFSDKFILTRRKTL